MSNLSLLCPEEDKLFVAGDWKTSKYSMIQLDFEYCFESSSTAAEDCLPDTEIVKAISQSSMMFIAQIQYKQLNMKKGSEPL